MAARLSFVSVAQLAKHFIYHGADFGCVDIYEYEKLARNFMGGTRQVHVLECTRLKGDILRYDPNIKAFGVVSSAGVLRTFYRPVPCVSLPPNMRERYCHGEATNEDYFSAECKKINK